jgi:potassium/sodium efflux P-type ATPase
VAKSDLSPLKPPKPGRIIAVGDRVNMAFRQTSVVQGNGLGVVVGVGLRTEIGKITERLTQRKKKVGKRQRKLSESDADAAGEEDDDTPTKVSADKGSKTRNANQETGNNEHSEIDANNTSPAVRGGSNKVGRSNQQLKEEEKDEKRRIVPLSVSMNRLLYILFFTGIVFGVFIFWAFDWNVNSSSLLYAASTLVAILPEAAIVLITVTMALGARRMVQSHAIVREMGALEQLGRVTDICSDKTGTLTQGKMRPARALVFDKDATGVPLRGFAIGGPALSRKAEWHRLQPLEEGGASGDDVGAPSRGDEVELQEWVSQLRSPEQYNSLLLVCALCSTTSLSRVPGDEDALTGEGNPTEIALQELVHKSCAALEGAEAGLWAAYEPRGEWTFTSDAKRMSSGWRHRETGKTLSLTKGAPERVLDSCINISQSQRVALDDAINLLASRGLRVLAMARRDDLDLSCKTLGDYPRSEVEQSLTFVGMVALRDPPKKESLPALRECKRAGITARMLTGDHQATAQAIARELQILPPDVDDPVAQGLLITGPELDAMSDQDLDSREELPLVVARASPESKVKIVEALHRRGRVVAMTGDGVNDSPALRTANVGVAMGITGSDVTKGVANLILADDNFSTIVSAVREGRRIFDSVSHFVLHLLTGNMAEAIVLMLALAFVTDTAGDPVFVLSPLAILYINTATGSPPAVGLALDRPSPDIMTRPPIRHGLYTFEMVMDFMIYGTIMGGLTLAGFSIVAWADGDGDFGTNCNERSGVGCELVKRARGAAFLTLNTLLILHAYNCRHLRASAFALPLLENKVLAWSLFIGTLVAIPILYVPWLNDEVFKHSGLTWEWAMVAVFTVVFEALAELYKFIKRRTMKPISTEVTMEEANDEQADIESEEGLQPRSGVSVEEEGAIAGRHDEAKKRRGAGQSSRGRGHSLGRRDDRRGSDGSSGLKSHPPEQKEGRTASQGQDNHGGQRSSQQLRSGPTPLQTDAGLDSGKSTGPHSRPYVPPLSPVPDENAAHVVVSVI